MTQTFSHPHFLGVSCRYPRMGVGRLYTLPFLHCRYLTPPGHEESKVLLTVSRTPIAKERKIKKMRSAATAVQDQRKDNLRG